MTPKYGYRSCESCETFIPLKIQRDIVRKRFCSRRCRSQWHYHNILIPQHNFGSALEGEREERRKRNQSESLKRTWQKQAHPMIGKHHTEQSKQLVSSSQKRRLRQHPERIPRGPNHPNWKGGRQITRGYIRLLVPGHHRANIGGYVLESVLVAEQMLGRQLVKGEIVHHKNRNTFDNSPANLQVMTISEHMKLHKEERKTGGHYSSRLEN